ncbi:hypothetical protein V8C86DRAFT_786592 [Haematococcus lacustris]
MAETATDAEQMATRSQPYALAPPPVKKRRKRKKQKKRKQHVLISRRLWMGLGGAAVAVAAGLTLWQCLRKRVARSGDASTSAPSGPCSKVRPTSKCVPLADGSACVVRRPIPADNSCLFNAVAYTMHHSKQKAEFLRRTVAQEVSSDPDTYSDAFLGAPNAAYCAWIIQPMNWGGGIELSILARHYGREIGTWNIESGKQHVFGEEAGYAKQVMLIYTGSHYDALAIAASPRAPEHDDKTEFNPRTKTGKMILAAAQRLVELNRKGGKRFKPGAKPDAKATTQVRALTCTECNTQCKDQQAAATHAEKTGHNKFAEK